jgi:hypothetical protein
MKKVLALINVVTAIIVICLMALAWTTWPSGSIDKDAVIIGGTEGPTVIWLTTGNVAYVVPMLFCVLLLVNAYALCKSTNSGGVRNPI